MTRLRGLDLPCQPEADVQVEVSNRLLIGLSGLLTSTEHTSTTGF